MILIMPPRAQAEFKLMLEERAKFNARLEKIAEEQARQIKLLETAYVIELRLEGALAVLLVWFLHEKIYHL